MRIVRDCLEVVERGSKFLWLAIYMLVALGRRVALANRQDFLHLEKKEHCGPIASEIL